MQLKVGQASRLPSQPWGISLNKRFRTSSLRGEAGRRYELFARTAVRAGQARRLPYLGLHRSIELDASFEIGDWELGAFGWAFSLKKLRCARRSGAHETATAGPRTVPVRSSIAGGKAQECSRLPRPSDVLRAGTARAPVEDAPVRVAGKSALRQSEALFSFTRPVDLGW